MKKTTKRSTKKKATFVIVRTCSAGVHVGNVLRRERNGEVVLSDARRVWRWKGANTLHELSLRGCDESYSRISEPVPEITIPNPIEIIPCSLVAQSNLSRSRWGA